MQYILLINLYSFAPYPSLFIRRVILGLEKAKICCANQALLAQGRHTDESSKKMTRVGIVYQLRYVVEDALLDGSFTTLLEGYTQERYPIH